MLKASQVIFTSTVQRRCEQNSLYRSLEPPGCLVATLAWLFCWELLTHLTIQAQSAVYDLDVIVIGKSWRHEAMPAIYSCTMVEQVRGLFEEYLQILSMTLPPGTVHQSSALITKPSAFFPPPYTTYIPQHFGKCMDCRRSMKAAGSL